MTTKLKKYAAHNAVNCTVETKISRIRREFTYDPKTVNWPVQSTAMTVACNDKYSLASKALEYI